MTKYLAILGGNALARAPIAHLNGLGYQTLVLDKNPEAPARDIASRFLEVDFANPEATIDAIVPFALSGVMALNDFGVRTAARIAKERSLPGFSPEAAENTCSKVHMKACWERAGLRTPAFAWATKSAVLAGAPISWDRYPCIVKPSFAGGGSRGVNLVATYEQLTASVRKDVSLFLNEEVIIEEYVQDATEHTVEVLIHDKRPHVLSVSDKLNYPGNISIVQRLHFPGRRGNRYRSRIETLMAEACAALSLTDGCAHFEILINHGETGAEDIYLLEVGGRPGGGINFAPICQLSTGYDYPRELATVLTGAPPKLVPGAPAGHLVWQYFSVPTGLLRSVEGFDEAQAHPSVIDAQLYVSPGSVVPEMTDDLKRPGYVLVLGATEAEADATAERLAGRVKFLVE